MADLRYNVSELFQSAFGLTSPVFLAEPINQDTKQSISFAGIETLPEYYQPDATSWMGTPILFNATLKGGNYKKYKANGEIETVSLNELVFPPATMFSFRRDKNITVTDVLGDQGTVKEIYGFDDWIIDVRGLCLDEPTQSAKQQLDELLKRENLADAIAIHGSQFTTRNIHKVVMRNWSDNVTQGKAGVISFQCQLLSDIPLELILP